MVKSAQDRVYPNSYIESSGIEPRLMMGAMTAKFRPDGFLYYEIAFWNSLEPITSGPIRVVQRRKLSEL